MSPELLARLIDVDRQADPTLLGLLRIVNALAHNNAVLAAELASRASSSRAESRDERPAPPPTQQPGPAAATTGPGDAPPT